MDMAPSAVKLRSKRKGPARYASEELEKVAAGWIVFRHERHLETTHKRFALFLERVVGSSPSDKWLAAFSKRHHLSLRSSRGQRQSLDQNANAFKAGVAYLRQLRELKIAPTNILCVDKIIQHARPCGEILCTKRQVTTVLPFFHLLTIFVYSVALFVGLVPR